MKKFFKILPLIFVLIYAIFLMTTNWENLNSIKIIGFSLGIFSLSYLIFMIITKKYIDFKDRMKIKNLELENKNKSIELIETKYLSISFYIVGLILLIIYLYNRIFLDIQLPYLLHVLIGISFLSLVLRVKKIRNTKPLPLIAKKNHEKDMKDLKIHAGGK